MVREHDRSTKRVEEAGAISWLPHTLCTTSKRTLLAGRTQRRFEWLRVWVLIACPLEMRARVGGVIAIAPIAPLPAAHGNEWCHAARRAIDTTVAFF